VNGIDPSGRDSLWAGGPDLGPIVPSIQIPDIPNPVDWAFNQVGQLGQDAERYWADRSNHDTGIAKFGDTVAGTLAAMADCNNLPITVTVLSLGTAVSGVAVASEALGRIVIRRYPNAAGGGITYRAPWRTRYSLDWHRFSSGGRDVFRPHFDRTGGGRSPINTGRGRNKPSGRSHSGMQSGPCCATDTFSVQYRVWLVSGE